MLLKYESDNSVPVLPVALTLNGKRPAAVIISTGIAEQKYPTIRPPSSFHFRSSGLTRVLAVSDSRSKALDVAQPFKIFTSFSSSGLQVTESWVQDGGFLWLLAQLTEKGQPSPLSDPPFPPPILHRWARTWKHLFSRFLPKEARRDYTWLSSSRAKGRERNGNCSANWLTTGSGNSSTSSIRVPSPWSVPQRTVEKWARFGQKL